MLHARVVHCVCTITAPKRGKARVTSNTDSTSDDTTVDAETTGIDNDNSNAIDKGKGDNTTTDTTADTANDAMTNTGKSHIIMTSKRVHS
jgi:hypothetical protein